MNLYFYFTVIILIALYDDEKLESAFCHIRGRCTTVGFGSIDLGDFGFHLLAPPESGSGEKTEEATPKKKKESRKKGQVAKSKELNALAGLLVIIFVLLGFGKKILTVILEFLTSMIYSAPSMDVSINSAAEVLGIAFTRILYSVSFVIFPVLIVGITMNLAQIGFIFTMEPLKVDFKKLNPIQGFKRIFSKKMLFEFAKNIAKLIAISLVVYTYFNGKKDELIISGLIENQQIFEYIGNIILGLLIRLAIIFTIIAALDFGFEKWSFKKQLRMSKQEVREEYKEMEGDPHIKSRRKQKQQQMSYNRMISNVPNASVIITNPTHFAVAIKYDMDDDHAPKVVAKGVDFLAQKIKEIAVENDIEIVENKPLARTLYKQVEIDQYIPIELFQVMAEILSMVYNKKKGT